MKAKPQILIVEDERITAEDIKRTLEYLGYVVSSIAASGRQAIKNVEENKPDLVLMDIKLRGDMDGVEAAKQISACFDIPIVYITGFSEELTSPRAKKTEPFGYINKPIGEEELQTNIEMALYRHNMQRKLKESEERYRNLVEQMRDVIYSLDEVGNVTSVNKAIKTMFGLKPEEVIGKNFAEFAMKEVIDKAREVFEQINAGESITAETIMIDKNRKLHNVEFSSTPIMKDGRVVGSQGIVRDITERKRAEEEKERLQARLIQSEKMVGIGTLAGGIAHEFNNLFQIMRGHIEFALKTKRQEDIEEAFDIAIYNIDKAAKIIRDLLSFSTQDAPESEPCDITTLVESVLSLTEEHLKKQNIKVVRKYGRTPKIEVNKGEIQQVFLSMVTNSRDAMSPKGGRLEIRIKKAKENVEVSISDTGRGIEKEDLSKVFEPFYTTKGAVGGNSKLQGIGLGLSVSYGIVKRHGGTIEVKSEVGKGTTFIIKLPVKGGSTEGRSVEAKEKREMRKTKPLNILAVDDEEDICNMFTKFLSSDGHRVKSALTGKKAINLIREENFDIVFLDIIMPGIPAIKVLEKIKEIYSKTEVVMITGKLMDEDLRNELRQKGASAFLQKPFKIENIMESVNSKG